MPVMTAGMHHPVVFRTVRQFLRFFYGKRINITAKTNHRMILFSLQCRYGSRSHNLFIGNPHFNKLSAYPGLHRIQEICGRNLTNSYDMLCLYASYICHKKKQIQEKS